MATDLRAFAAPRHQSEVRPDVSLDHLPWIADPWPPVHLAFYGAALGIALFLIGARVVAL